MRILLAIACLCGALAFPGLAAATPTLVSLTFDDGLSNQYQVDPMLAQHGMHATFYIPSGSVGSSGNLTWDQLSVLQADGNEIGGHTVDHVDLTTLTTTQATAEVCNDRNALTSHGLTVTDFAYPYGAYNASVEGVVSGCGYSSARRSWGLCPISDSLAQCAAEPFAKDPVEPVPPPDVLATRTLPSVLATTSLGDLENAVTRGENAGGGWITFVFHNVCDGCDPNGYSISPATLNSFLDWLAARAATGTSVRTVRDVVSDHTAPVSSIACNGGTCSTWFNQAVTVSLAATDAGTAVAAIRYTTDGSDPTSSSPLYTAPFNVPGTTTVKYRAWDMAGNVEATNTQLVQVDSAPPVSSIACNSAPCSSSAYASPVGVTISASDSGGSGVAAIRYTTDGSDPTASSTLYSGAFTVSSSTTVKYRAWDVAGNVETTNSRLVQIAAQDTTAPTTTIACNGGACSGGWYGAAVTVSLSATDPDDAVAAVRYTLNGSDPTTSSTIYSGPFAVSSTTTVKYRAWDSAGNVEATNSRLIQIDATPPSVTITSPVDGTSVTGNVKVVASPSDAQSGVVSVSFYVDGALIGTATKSPWQVAWNTKRTTRGTHSLTAVATDAAGNRTTSAAVSVTVR